MTGPFKHSGRKHEYCSLYYSYCKICLIDLLHFVEELLALKALNQKSERAPECKLSPHHESIQLH